MTWKIDMGRESERRILPTYQRRKSLENKGGHGLGAVHTTKQAINKYKKKK